MTAKRESSILRKSIRAIAQGLQIGVLAEVVSYDSDSRSGTVQPLMVDPVSGERPAPMPKIPFFHVRGGPFILRAPPAAGDAAIVMVLDRSFDEWLLSGDADAEPAVSWLRNPSHAVAWVGIGSFNEDVLPGISADDLILGLTDGSAFFSMTPGGVAVVKSADIRLGSASASDPVVLRAELVSWLTTLMTSLGSGSNSGGPVVWGVPLPSPGSISGSSKVKAE